MAASLLLAPAAGAATNVSQSPAKSAKPPANRSEQMARRVDALLEAQWQAAGVEPAPRAGDAEFLRRASLDLTGVIPRVSEVRDFLANDAPDKRIRLVDDLLASSRYATHMATTWRNRILPQGADPARARQAMALQKWLRARFARNLRYDNLVGSLLLTNGGDELGPALYYQAHDVAPEKIAASAGEMFLGVKLHCAQCHDHPYADWSQREFWGLAAFFAQVRSPGNMGMSMSYRLVDGPSGDVKLPDSDEVVPPRYPRGDAAPDAEGVTRRHQLVFWMTSRDNRFFARAAVNWAWSHMFGRGLVPTLDEVDDENPSTEAKLLDELAEYFVDSGFDLKALWRTLASTRAYQLSTTGTLAAEHAPDPDLLASMHPKPLTPEQLYDSFVILSPPKKDGGAPALTALGQPVTSLDEDPARMEFVRRMRPPPGEATEYRAGTLQALMLMNGQTTAAVTAADGSRLLGALDAPFMEDDDRIEALFLATLARTPDEDERKLFVEALEGCETPADRQRALSDMFWALLNSTEFAFNH